MMARSVLSANSWTYSTTWSSVLAAIYGGATTSRSNPWAWACWASDTISFADVFVTCAAMGQLPAASSATESMTSILSSWVRLQNSPMPQVQPPPVVPRLLTWLILRFIPSTSTRLSTVKGVINVVHWPFSVSQAHS